jgi:hypothetical protein
MRGLLQQKFIRRVPGLKAGGVGIWPRGLIKRWRRHHTFQV